MDKQKYKDTLEKALDITTKALEVCEPELLPKYVETLLLLSDRLYDLERQLWN